MNEVSYTGTNFSIGSAHIPAAVPQLGGTHHADLKRLSMRSLEKCVTLRWICRRLSTNAKPTPTAKSRHPRTSRDVHVTGAGIVVGSSRRIEGLVIRGRSCGEKRKEIVKLTNGLDKAYSVKYPNSTMLLIS